MKISINGKIENFDTDILTFESLIKELNLAGKRFAIERNGEIIPKSCFADYQLSNGDKLEIIGAVGGG
ncbi:sulfur carrier protein ThiS [Methylophilaceae bacterium]|nr:sulfur carrier protein ThiS [Methylophilaceae bacterium]